MAQLTKNDLFPVTGNRIDTVEITEPAGTINIKHITVRQRELVFEALFEGATGTNNGDIKRKSMINAQLLLVSFSLVDDKGVEMYTLDELLDMHVSNQKTIDVLYTEAEKINATFSASEEDVVKN